MASPLKQAADEILEALESASHQIKRALKDRQRNQADRIRDQNQAIRDADGRMSSDADAPNRNDPSTPTPVNASSDGPSPIPVRDPVDLATPTPGTGPVVFRARPDTTPEELQQLQRYIDTSNAARLDGQLSPTGRVSTQGALRAEASAEAAAERARALAAGTPYQGQVGHAPDTTWTGNPVGREWHDQTQRVNASLGGQASHYPVGYIPTVFQLQMPDGSVYPVLPGGQ